MVAGSFEKYASCPHGIRQICLIRCPSRRWPTRFPRLPHPLPVDANQRPDEQQELADEDEHCLVDDPLRRYPERRDADDCRYDSEPDGDDFFGT